mgnify:CR=1 FL=1
MKRRDYRLLLGDLLAVLRLPAVLRAGRFAAVLRLRLAEDLFLAAALFAAFLFRVRAAFCAAARRLADTITKIVL